MAALLAEALGTDSEQISKERSSMSVGELSCETVQQQIALRLRYCVIMLGHSAEAAGAEPSSVSGVKGGMV